MRKNQKYKNELFSGFLEKICRAVAFPRSLHATKNYLTQNYKEIFEGAGWGEINDSTEKFWL